MFPTIKFGSGMSYMRFKGIVIAKERKEIPSNKAKMRKIPSEVLKCMVFKLIQDQNDLFL